MFAPQRDLTNIHGAPGVSGQSQDRYKPATDKRFVKPTEQIRVGPGINVGPDVISTGGFHDQTRFMPQLVDEHRLNQLPGKINAGSVRAGMNKRDYTPAEFSTVPKTTEYSEDRPRQMIQSKAMVNGNTQRPKIFMNQETVNGSVPFGIAAPAAVPQSGTGPSLNGDVNINTDREWCDSRVNSGMITGPVATLQHGSNESMGQIHTTDRELSSIDFNAKGHYERNMAGGKTGAAPTGGANTTTNRATYSANQPANAVTTSSFAPRGVLPTEATTNTTMREMVSQSDSGHVGGAFSALGNGSGKLMVGKSGQPGTETHRETYNQSSIGPAPASSVVGAPSGAAPITYDQLLKQQGLSLRSVTDDARAPNTLRLNENPTGSVHGDALMADGDRVKVSVNYKRSHVAQRQNEFTSSETLILPENNPNRIEVLNDRVTSIAQAIPAQLKNNPLIPKA